MGRQGTWEILLLPAGKNAGKGNASMRIQTPVRRRACTATGALQGGHKTDRHLRSRLAKPISRRPCKGRKS